jgi:hypothetical protein
VTGDVWTGARQGTLTRGSSRVGCGGAQGPNRRRPQMSPRHRSKPEFSGGSLLFIFFAWVVFFVLWIAVGSLLVAAIVFGVLLSGGIALIDAR